MKTVYQIWKRNQFDKAVDNLACGFSYETEDEATADCEKSYVPYIAPETGFYYVIKKVTYEVVDTLRPTFSK